LNGCACRLLPRSCGLRRAVTRVKPEQASPKATFVTRLRLGRYSTEPLVSFQTYRQLSGWNPPPLVIRANCLAIPLTRPAVADHGLRRYPTQLAFRAWQPRLRSLDHGTHALGIERLTALVEVAAIHCAKRCFN
jgi:hypothetical protein